MYDRQTEQAVLGAMALNRNAVWRAAAKLNAEDLYYPEHQQLFDAMVYNAQQGLENEPLTLRDACKQLGHADMDLAYLAEILNQTSSTSNLMHYTQRVKALSQRRQMQIRLQAGLRDVCESEAPPEALSAALIDDLAQVGAAAHSESVPLMGAVKGALEHLDNMIEHKMAMMGVPTGFIALDEMTSGLLAGDLYIIAARPSIGKTALSLSMARHVARQGHRVALFNLEMDRTQIAQRLLAIESDVPLSLIRTGHHTNGAGPVPIDATESANLSAGIQRLKAYDLVINDTPHLTPLLLRAELARLHRERPLSLVVVDYLQLMSGNAGQDEYARVSEASRQLKLLAREFKVPILALSQLNRECESRPDKKPQLSDLRSSGSLEQDADLVMLLYRPGHYGIEQVNGHFFGADQTEILLVKHRNGPTGTVPLYWLKHTAEFQSC